MKFKLKNYKQLFLYTLILISSKISCYNNNHYAWIEKEFQSSFCAETNNLKLKSDLEDSTKYISSFIKNYDDKLKNPTDLSNSYVSIPLDENNSSSYVFIPLDENNNGDNNLSNSKEFSYLLAFSEGIEKEIINKDLSKSVPPKAENLSFETLFYSQIRPKKISKPNIIISSKAAQNISEYIILENLNKNAERQGYFGKLATDLENLVQENAKKVQNNIIYGINNAQETIEAGIKIIQKNDSTTIKNEQKHSFSFFKGILNFGFSNKLKFKYKISNNSNNDLSFSDISMSQDNNNYDENLNTLYDFKKSLTIKEIINPFSIFPFGETIANCLLKNGAPSFTILIQNHFNAYAKNKKF